MTKSTVITNVSRNDMPDLSAASMDLLDDDAVVDMVDKLLGDNSTPSLAPSKKRKRAPSSKPSGVVVACSASTPPPPPLLSQQVPSTSSTTAPPPPHIRYAQHVDEQCGASARTFHEFVHLVLLYETLSRDERRALCGGIQASLSTEEREICVGRVSRCPVRDTLRSLCYSARVNFDLARELTLHRMEQLGIRGLNLSNVTDKLMVKNIDLWYEYPGIESCEWSCLGVTGVDIRYMLQNNTPMQGRACKNCINALLRLGRNGLCAEFDRVDSTEPPKKTDSAASDTAAVSSVAKKKSPPSSSVGGRKRPSTEESAAAGGKKKRTNGGGCIVATAALTETLPLPKSSTEPSGFFDHAVPPPSAPLSSAVAALSSSAVVSTKQRFVPVARKGISKDETPQMPSIAYTDDSSGSSDDSSEDDDDLIDVAAPAVTKN